MKFYKERLNSKYSVVLFLLLSFICLYFSFYKNSLHAAEDHFFDNFQLDSEGLVIGQIIKDHELYPHKHSNLGNYWLKEDKTGTEIKDISLQSDRNEDNSLYVPNNYYSDLKTASGYRLIAGEQIRAIKEVTEENSATKILYYGEPLDLNNIKTVTVDLKKHIESSEYTSQYGLQGRIFSYCVNKLGMSKKSLHRANSILLAIVILVLTVQIGKIFSRDFAVIFLFSIIFSPWVVSFARNLYWIEFSWLLPSVFAWAIFLIKSFKTKCCLFLGIFLSCWFKCLSGYEYFSSVLMFAIAPNVFQILMAENKKCLYKNVQQAFFICLTGTLGFIAALLMHAYLRSGGNISDGLSAIWSHDVLRRTYGGNVKDFAPVYADSFNASTFTVLKKYVLQWRTEVISIPIIKWFSFRILLVLSIIAIIFSYRHNRKESRYNLSLIITFCLPAISWYVLGKSHSFIHTHMNYVLWYMGGIGAIFYVLYRDLTSRWNYVQKV